MSRSKLTHSEQFNFKISPELRQELERLFGKKGLSGKVREYLVEKITKDKQKKFFNELDKRDPAGRSSKLDEVIAIIGLKGDAGKRRMQRFKATDFKPFSLLCRRFLEHSQYYSQEAKKAFICYYFNLKEPFPEHEELETVIEYLEKER